VKPIIHREKKATSEGKGERGFGYRKQEKRETPSCLSNLPGWESKNVGDMAGGSSINPPLKKRGRAC